MAVQQPQRDEKNGQRAARPKLMHLRSFFHLARLGSMTAAAEDLGISQPTMSDHIEQLERGFEEKLFTRGPTGVSLTATGHALRRAIEHPIGQLDKVTFQSLTRPVILGGPPDMLLERALSTLAPLIAQERIRVHVRPGIPEDLIRFLRDRTIDLFIATRRLNPGDFRVKYHRLFKEEYVLVGDRTWKQRLDGASSDEAAANVLADAPFLAFDEDLPIIRDHPLIAAHEETIFGDDPLARVPLVMPNLCALRNVAIAHGGVTVLPRYIADDALRSGELFELHQPEDRVFNQIYLAHRDEPQWEVVGRIVEELRAKAPGWETKPPKGTRAASADRAAV